MQGYIIPNPTKVQVELCTCTLGKYTVNNKDASYECCNKVAGGPDDAGYAGVEDLKTRSTMTTFVQLAWNTS